MMLRNLTTAISKLSTIALVLLCSIECMSNSGIATIKPNAVVFIASEMLCDNSVAFSAGSALATAVNAAIKPMIVPSNPSKVAMLATRSVITEFN